MTRAHAAAAATTKRCAIYTRKSVAKGLEQEFNSLDAQRESCLSHIQRQTGWTVVETRYDDGGFTGANIDRPAFQRLLADVDARKIDIIVVYKVDRLSRSLLDFAGLMERINNAGASFVSVTQNFSTADAMGRLTLNMLMSFAEFEREMIAERTRDKVQAARRRGKWTGGWCPFGYTNEKGQLFPHELEAITVRRAFALLLEQRQVFLVRRALNAEGLLPRGARLPNGKPPRWTNDSVGRLLRSPVYAGLIQAGQDQCPGEHAALIDADTFREAQVLLGGNAPQSRPAGLNLEYILQGLLRCGLCGAAMSPASTRTRGRQYRYYRCSTRDKAGKEACAAAPLSAGGIESYVVERISGIATDRAFVEAAREGLERHLQLRRRDADVFCRMLPPRIATLSSTTAKLVSELIRLDGRARQAVEAKLRSEGEALALLEQQLAEAQRTRAELNRLSADAAWVAGALADFPRIWGVLTVANRGRLLRALIERVVVDEAAAKTEIQLVDFAAPLAKEAA